MTREHWRVWAGTGNSEAAPGGAIFRITRIVLITAFAGVSTWFVAVPIRIGLPFGWDAVVYAHAAQALLSGGDPWLQQGNIAYAAPPPSLLLYLPFAWMSDALISVTWVGISALSAVYAIRRLNLPLWWLLFPPIVLGVAAGNGAVFALALMVRGGMAGEAIAVSARIYSVLPLLLLGRWRSLVASGVLLLITAPFLAWPAFIAARETVSQTFADQADSGFSATAVPLLIPVALVCLALLGRKRAAWLIVPVLWPFTQPYYAVLALPALASLPLTALSLTIPIPGLVVVGMAADLVRERLLDPRARRPNGIVGVGRVGTVHPEDLEFGAVVTNRDRSDVLAG
jgi:hypothetical protein